LVIIPKTRGLTAAEIGNTSSTSPTTSNAIVSVVGSAKGWLKVRTSSHVELRSGGTIAWRNNNPGNLKEGPFSRQHGSVGKDYIGHAVFPTYNIGKNAAFSLLFSGNSVYNNLSIEAAMKRYAPTSDGNNPNSYANVLARAVNKPKTTRLSQLTSAQKETFLRTLFRFEGYSVGKVTRE